ncbi:beta-lactamase [Lipomyces kononenkoae]|uniref:Beta-lactamase n=1 Tax=Lipomyces kononenkoae TaxID=34357 RepID=A0ACC3T7J9_LIPKO
MAVVQGYCDPKFEKLKALLEHYVNSGEEIGASVAVNIDGKMVVDIYGGFIDEDRTKPCSKDTIVNVWSSTKTITALAVLMLHDRGLLDVNEKVSKYWPEFAANGKEDVRVRHLLSHTSGVSGWEQPVTLQDLYDTKASTDRLAQQSPWWEPGTASGYHSLSMGHLLGEVVRRVTGKSLSQFVFEEIAEPLGADFQIGAKESDWGRIAPVVPPPAADFGKLDPESITIKTFGGPVVHADDANTPEWRRAEVGAANGHTNARALCQILSAISLGGTFNGNKLLSQKTIDLIFEPQADGIDLAMGLPIRFGIGYGIAGGGTEQSMPHVPPGQNRRICFWGGWGGSFELMDLDKHMTFAYTMNKMGPGTLGTTRTSSLVKACYEALEEALESN